MFLQQLPKYSSKLLGYFLKYNFHVKEHLATLWAIMGKMGQLFIPSSGHTASLQTYF